MNGKSWILPGLIALGGCSAAVQMDSATAKQHYLEAKAACVAEYPSSLVEQSDCRSRAADTYIRPFYRYGDLMTRAQEQRREFASQADRHEISRRTYERQVARSEAAIAREEDRRNKMPGEQNGPFASLSNAIAGWFR